MEKNSSKEYSVVFLVEGEKFNLMNGSILPVAIPPGHTPGD